jgi:hypothetical protein
MIILQSDRLLSNGNWDSGGLAGRVAPIHGTKAHSASHPASGLGNLISITPLHDPLYTRRTRAEGVCSPNARPHGGGKVMDNTYAKGGAQRSAGGAAVAGQKESHVCPTQPCMIDGVMPWGCCMARRLGCYIELDRRETCRSTRLQVPVHVTARAARCFSFPSLYRGLAYPALYEVLIGCDQLRKESGSSLPLSGTLKLPSNRPAGARSAELTHPLPRAPQAV